MDAQLDGQLGTSGNGQTLEEAFAPAEEVPRRMPSRGAMEGSWATGLSCRQRQVWRERLPVRPRCARALQSLDRKGG